MTFTRSGTTCTVVRGQEGTTAVTHTAGAQVAYDPQDRSQDTYMTFAGCSSDSNVLSGFAVTSGSASNTNYADLVGCHARNNGGNGINISGGTPGDAGARGRVVATVTGGKFIDNDVGIYSTQLEAVAVVGAVCRDSTSHGIHISNQANGGVVDGCDLRNNGGWGLRASGVSDLVRVGVNRYGGNVSGHVSVDGSGSTVAARVVPFNNQTVAIRSGTTTWNPPSIADGETTSTTVTVTGANLVDTVAVGFAVAVPAAALLVGAVTATNQVTVTLYNKTGGALDLASGTLAVTVFARQGTG